MLFLITCSCGTRNIVQRKQNREWLSQGSILQIAHLSYSAYTTSYHSEDLRLKNLVEQSGEITTIC